MAQSAPKLVSWVLDSQHEWSDAVVFRDIVVGQALDGTLCGWRATPDGDISSLWRHEDTGSTSPLAATRDRTFVVGIHEGVTCFSASSGECLWEAALGSSPRAIAVCDDQLWVAYDSSIGIFDESGKLLVAQDIEMEARWLHGRESTVDAWSHDEYICLSRPQAAQPSSIMWLARNPVGIEVDAVAFDRDSAVVRKAGGKNLRLFHQFDSAWGQSVDGAGRLGEPGIDTSRSRVLATLTTGEVIAWDAGSGDMLWHSEPGAESEEFHPPPAPFFLGEYLIAGTRSGLTRIFDADTGRLLGQTKVDDQRRLMPFSDMRFLSLGSALRIYGLQG